MILLLVGSAVAGFYLLRLDERNIFLLLPFASYLTQALGYSVNLLEDDRYIYVCNPMLYLQLALLIQLATSTKSSNQRN